MKSSHFPLFFWALFLISCVFNGVLSLYEDQIGKFDWRQKYIGCVHNALFDSKLSGRKLIVATEQNILAAIDPRDGNLLWRQIYESNERGRINFIHQYKDVLTLSGGGSYLRFWDTNSGAIISEQSIPFSSVQEIESLFSYNNNKNIVYRVDLYENSHFIVNSHSVSDEVTKAQKVPALWLKSDTRCVIMTQGYLACADAAMKTIFISNLSEDNIVFENHATSLTEVLDIYEVANNMLVIKMKLSTILIKFEGTKIVQTVNFESEVVHLNVEELNDQVLIFELKKKENQVYEVSARNSETNTPIPELTSQIELPKNSGEIQKMWIHAFVKKDGKLGCRMLASLTDHSLVMINYSGKTIWVREEALATILSVEMLELPVSETEARFEQEFGAVDSNIVTMFIQRLTTQGNQFASFVNNLVTHLSSGHVASSFSGHQNKKLVRDEFNLHKMIVVASSAGKLFGLDNLSGAILWKKFIPGLAHFKTKAKNKLPLFVQRTTAHFPNKPQCVVLGMQKGTGNSMLYFFDPITGLPVSGMGQEGLVRLPVKALQATLINFHDNHFLKPILILDSSEKVHVFPQSGVSVVKQNCESYYLFVADTETGFVSGYGFQHSTDQEILATKMWQILLPKASQKIIHVVAKRAIERVHSQGRVMGDRSVLYKYLNPNLIVVVTEGSDSNAKPYFYIYLVDGVTGQIVHSIIHRRATGPIHVVHSENWIVYSYFNEKSRRTDIGVLELFEGKTQSNTTVFSSLHPPMLPIIEKQAYIFPISGIHAMADSITEKGMTSKHILVALPNGGILEIPKYFLDPRRPIVMTMELREEGLMPYIPELPIPAEHIINYNQSLAKIRDMYTAPAGLESTCLVFAYGLDLYYTRITPSKTFDVLKDDFDHYFIALVLFGLIFTSYLTKRLAAHKALKQAWK